MMISPSKSFSVAAPFAHPPASAAGRRLVHGDHYWHLDRHRSLKRIFPSSAGFQRQPLAACLAVVESSAVRLSVAVHGPPVSAKTEMLDSLLSVMKAGDWEATVGAMERLADAVVAATETVEKGGAQSRAHVAAKDTAPPFLDSSFPLQAESESNLNCESQWPSESPQLQSVLLDLFRGLRSATCRRDGQREGKAERVAERVAENGAEREGERKDQAVDERLVLRAIHCYCRMNGR